MSEIENKTQEKRRLAQEEAAKKKKKSTWLKIGAVLFVLVFAALAVYESSFITRLVPAAKVKNTTYTVAEYNWMYTSNYYQIYNTIYQQYGNYASLVLDTKKSLEKQKYSSEQTWAEYLREYTDKSLETLTALHDQAEAAGFVLDDSQKEQIQTDWDNLVSTAKSSGYTAGAYLETAYGRGVNEKVYKEMYERYLYAYSYGDSVSEGFEISDSEIDARYNENKLDYDRVTYEYYFVSGSASEGVTEEDAMKQAKEKAEAALASEDLAAYIKSEFDSELTESRYVSHSGANEAFADWLFEDSRAAGDKEVFEATNGYYIVVFEAKEDLHYNMVSVRHLLVKPEDSTSTDSWDAAKEKAEGYLETYKSLGETEDNFGYLALAYSEDSGSKSNGGLYENIQKGQMVKEFEDWCFDSARKEGDVEIIRTNYGYHLMYFVGVGEDYYHHAIDSDIRSEKYTEYIEGIKEGYTLTNGSAKFMAAKHL